MRVHPFLHAFARVIFLGDEGNFRFTITTTAAVAVAVTTLYIPRCIISFYYERIVCMTELTKRMSRRRLYDSPDTIR